MTTDDLTALSAGFTAPSDDLTVLLTDLVRIDSQNPYLVSGAPGERAIAEFCVGWLTRHGVEAWIDDVAPGRCNAIARIGSGAAPVLTLCAHLDTVSIEGMERHGLQPYVEGGRMYGRGAYDMKCGVAAILSAMAELAKRPPGGTVMAALVCDEEFASIGAQDFVKRYRSDACIVTEPSEGKLILAHKGFVWAEIETRGVAAHGSRWQDGASAIAKMGQVIAALDEFDRTTLRGRTHPLLGPASMHCAMISGGDGWSTYAPSCTMRVERRTLPGETPASVLDELRAIVARAGEDAIVREVLSRAPLECPAESSVAQSVSAAAAAVTGAAPEIGGVAYWMDAAIFAEAGAETVNFGPSGGGAHAAVEWVDLDSVVACARTLVDAACRSVI
ncbi:MAG TPA: M20/M25/M40 family metallo-hydrolase [Longimicrobiales bacterium]|nr:M20/M25/M40 family metallo-hydrolase [Longimicrobiales bacterium]